MGIFTAFVELLDSVIEANYKEEERIEKERLAEREKRKAEIRERERIEWEKASKAERENPDEWRVLPYGWSPFGIYI
jgi:hypothetical protein